MDGWETGRDWKGDIYPVGAKGNRNQFRRGKGNPGYLHGFNRDRFQKGTVGHNGAGRYGGNGNQLSVDWPNKGWGATMLDFWDDFSADGRLEPRDVSGHDMPIGSLAVECELPPSESRR
jgi:hypothetical protein